MGGLRAFLRFQYRVSAKRVLVGELDENGVIWCNGVISEENQGFRAIRSITGGSTGVISLGIARETFF